MKTLSTNLPCPSCHGPMTLSAVHCSPCDLTVAGHFEVNEFAKLGAEDLHFLRVFINAEGKVREMEAPLGLSYPTIRSRLAELKEKLQMRPAPKTESTPSPKTETKRAPSSSLNDTFDQLERGEIDFEKALASVRKRKK